MTTILIRRGLIAGLPVLNSNEFGFATDTKQLFIGTASGNKEITINDMDDLSDGIINAVVTLVQESNWDIHLTEEVEDAHSVPFQGYGWQPVNLSNVSGSSHDVSTEMSGRVAGGSGSIEGVVTDAQYNRVIIQDLAYDNVLHSSGSKVYGRITESSGTWTLSFKYIDGSGNEQIYSDFSNASIQWWVQRTYSFVNAPIYAHMFFVPSDQVAGAISLDNISSHIIPNGNNIYTLGDSSNGWKELHISTAKISYSTGIKLEAQAYSPTHNLGTTSGVVGVDFANGNTQKITLNGNATFTFSNAVIGAFYNLIVTQDGVGSRTISWPAGSKGPGGSIDISSASGAIDMFSIYVRGSGDYLIAAANDFS